MAPQQSNNGNTDRPRMSAMVNGVEIEITAAGVLVYRKNQETDEIEVLVHIQDGFYTDLGGQSAKGDYTISDIASREAAEETEGWFNWQFMKNKFRGQRAFYTVPSKYALFLHEGDCDPSQLESDEGEFMWVSLEPILSGKTEYKLHPRMSGAKDGLEELIKIENIIR